MIVLIIRLSARSATAVGFCTTLSGLSGASLSRAASSTEQAEIGSLPRSGGFSAATETFC
jgi:hypothetical protein